MRAILTATAIAAATGTAGAQVAQNMTCPQAQAYYAQHGRINVVSHGKDIVPIYGGVPYDQRNRLICDYGYVRSPYTTRTADGVRCVILFRCVPGGFDFDR